MINNVLKVFIAKWENIRQKDYINYTLIQSFYFACIFTIVKDWGLIVEAINNDHELLKQVLQNFLNVFAWTTVAFSILFWLILENIYLKLMPESSYTNGEKEPINYSNLSCKERKLDPKSTEEIKKEISTLINSLELGNYKQELLDELQFNFRLKCFDDEDYSQLGNTRLGGLPDLPKDIEYPHNEEGYYNLLCQINFAEFENKLEKLPEKGLLYIFDGHSSEDDFVTIYTESLDNLEKKYPPQGMKNLNEEYNKTYYDGLKVRFEIEHFFGEKIYDVYEYDMRKYNSLIESNSYFRSHILGKSIDSLDSAYLHLKGFETLKYESLLDREINEFYHRNFSNSLKECELEICKNNEKSEYFHRKKEQLLKFDSEKEIHFNSWENVTCLIGLESLDRLGWMWGDSGFKYVYILDEDLKNRNFSNLLVETWSS